MPHLETHNGLEEILTHIIQDFMQLMQQTGLSMLQIHALLYIYHTSECQISEIGALTGSSPAAASQLTERLVQQGLVQRREDPINRRIKKLRLTDKGLNLINMGVSSNHILRELMSRLTTEQLATVHTAIGYIAQAIRQIQFTDERKDGTDA